MLKSLHNAFTTTLEVLVVDLITNALSDKLFYDSQWIIQKNIRLADGKFNLPKSVCWSTQAGNKSINILATYVMELHPLKWEDKFN